MANRREVLFAALTGTLAASSASRAAGPPAGPRAGYFPNARLNTHDGRQVRFYDDVVRGDKIVVFNMMYTVCANICPPTTANLLRLQAQLGPRMGRDIFFYSLTLQPELDSPAALREYAAKYGVVGPGWTFLTGARGDMDTIRRKLGFYDIDPVVDADLSRHSGMLRIGREARDRWSMMPAQLTTRQLSSAILAL